MVRTQVLKTAFAVLVCGSIACGRQAAEPPPFDEVRAYGFLASQMERGPRVPGSEAHRQTAEWLAAELGRVSEHVSFQPFVGLSGDREVGMRNILCSLYPDKTARVLLCAHWDCRPWADRDPDPARHGDPVPGANDGASGVAVLLEVAAAVSRVEPAVGVDIVLFDGEDGGSYSDNESWLLGSRHFARTMPEGYRPRYAVLVDMIGDRDLGLTRDQNSARAAPALWNRVLAGCGEQGIPFNPGVTVVLDDHVPLIERGIPAVDLIDFDYPYWHTVEDTADKCSPESLGRIGRLVLGLLYEEE